MAPTHKVNYFNLTGQAEPIKYTLSYGNLPFEDHRIEFKDWPKFKEESAPFGRVPTLEVNGKLYHQTAAICRYLAKQVGLYGKTDEDAYEADAIVDTIVDFRENMSKYVKAKDADSKAARLEELRTVHTPYYFQKLESILVRNGGHFVKGQLTWADFYFAAGVDRVLNVLNEPFLNNYPNLKKLKEKVDNLPGVKEYLARRPEGVKF